VKRCIADDSVGSPHAKVGHCQALITKNPVSDTRYGVFFWRRELWLLETPEAMMTKEARKAWLHQTG
jgi:hypothetical protein